MIDQIKVLDVTEQMGELLKSAREAAGLSVDDVAFRTRLPRSVLMALECDDFSAFAGPVYAKSFLAQYSEFLNVDAQPWLDALEPGSFAAAGLLHPVVEAPAAEAVPEPVDVQARGGWWSVLGLFALSVSLMVAAVKGYEFFESRFSKDARHPPVEQSSPPQPAAVSPAAKRADPRPSVERQDEELGKPPPRAIIVR